MRMLLTEIDESVTTVVFDGSLDDAAADDVGLQFTAAVAVRSQHSIVDVSRVTFIGAGGLGLLTSAARALEFKGGRLVLFGAVGPVRAILDSASDRVAAVVSTKRDAMALLPH